MAIPGLDQTWRFSVNNTIPAGGSVNQTHKNVYGAIYWALRGLTLAGGGGALAWTDSAGAGASAPVVWTPESMHDGGGSFGNNDQVDRIIDAADVINGVTDVSNSTWYVIKHAASGVQIASFLGDVGAGNAANLRDAWIISLNGFGSTNGGADGDANSLPTATDESRMWASGTGQFAQDDQRWLGDPPGAVAHKMHVLASSDGECWRIIVQRNGHTVFIMFLDVPRDPVILDPDGTPHTFNGDDKPFAGIALSSISDGAANRAGQFAFWSASVGGQSNRLAGHLGSQADSTLSTPVEMSMATERILTGGREVVTQLGVSPLNNKHSILPIGIWGETGGFTGRAGRLTDVWFGTDTDLGVAEGDTYPNDLTRQLTAFSTFILPWNGTVPLTS